MTDRIPLDHLTSNQYDALCAELDRLTAELSDYEQRVEQLEADVEQQIRNTKTLAREKESYRQAWKEAQRMRGKAEQRAREAERHADPELRRQLDAAIEALGKSETELAELREQFRLIDGMRQQNLDAAAAAVQRAERAEGANARVRALADSWDLDGPPPGNRPLTELRAALDQPCAPETEHAPTDGIRHTRTTRVDTRTWTGTPTPELDAWLGDNHLGTNGTTLTVRNADNIPVHVRPGWILARYPDHALIVYSPAAAAHDLTEETR